MSFQGADVDGLDRTANRCMESADFADTVARTLEILVAALEAMSWTGFAAALAAYLKAVVIPWVKYIAKCLRIFGGLLQLASSKQKGASEDAPPVRIPATAWNPPPAPVATGVNPPMLASPQPAIQQTAPGTGAQTGGGTSVAPAAPIGRTDGGAGAGNVRGGGSITTTTGISSDGELWTRTTVSGTVTPATLTAPATIAAAGSTGGLGTGSGGHTAAPVTPAADLGIGGGTSIGGSGPAGSGSSNPGAGGSGSTGGPSTGSIGSGSSGAGGSNGGDGTTGTPTLDPAVQSSPLASRAVLGSTATGTGTASLDVAAPATGGGASAALAAAPIGLAGVGGAALAALRAKGLHDGDDQEEADDAL